MRPVLATFGRRGQQVLLALGAFFGVACLLTTLVAPLVHVRPLIFLSGSMSPTVTTGSLGLAHTTAAADLRVGDVVTVPAGKGAYLTHRIVRIIHHGDTATLQLKGDANKHADPAMHEVLEAPRLFASVPHAGAVVAWLSRTPGVYLLAAYVVFALGALRRRREQLRRGRGADDSGAPGAVGAADGARAEEEVRAPVLAE
jgi:signal peptidase I